MYINIFVARCCFRKTSIRILLRSMRSQIYIYMCIHMYVYMYKYRFMHAAQLSMRKIRNQQNRLCYGLLLLVARYSCCYFSCYLTRIWLFINDTIELNNKQISKLRQRLQATAASKYENTHIHTNKFFYEKNIETFILCLLEKSVYEYSKKK